MGGFHAVEMSKVVIKLSLCFAVQAIPILNDALSALDTIKEADIAYIKKLTNPPSAIKLVLEAVCVVLDAKPVKVCALWFAEPI
jgi:hypothetical protein